MIREFIHRLRGHNCLNCSHWMHYEFAVGDCGWEMRNKHFVSLNGYVGSNRVCKHWIPNLEFEGKRLRSDQVEYILKKAKENGYRGGVPVDKMRGWLNECK